MPVHPWLHGQHSHVSPVFSSDLLVDSKTARLIRVCVCVGGAIDRRVTRLCPHVYPEDVKIQSLTLQRQTKLQIWVCGRISTLLFVHHLKG